MVQIKLATERGETRFYGMARSAGGKIVLVTALAVAGVGIACVKVGVRRVKVEVLTSAVAGEDDRANVRERDRGLNSPIEVPEPLLGVEPFNSPYNRPCSRPIGGVVAFCSSVRSGIVYAGTREL